MHSSHARQLFERFGYSTQFMLLSSGAFSEMSYALAAMDFKDDECALYHAKFALELLAQRDELDKRYNSGKWEHWYDRDLIYPCRSVTDKLREAVIGSMTFNVVVGVAWLIFLATIGWLWPKKAGQDG